MEIFEICAQAWDAGDLSTCKPLGFDLLGWIAILTPAVGIAAFLLTRVGRAKTQNTAAKVGWRPWRNRFRGLCAAIEPLLDENGRLFRQFGPNSGRGDGTPKLVRHDLTVWKQLIPKIVTNNSKIRELIIWNRRAIPWEHRPLFTDWINHIDAFEAHAMDDLADYRGNQFPVAIVALVHENARR